MGRTCGKQEREEKFTQHFVENMKGSKHLEDLVIIERKDNIKLNLKEHEPVASNPIHENDSSRFKIGGKFLGQPREFYVLKKAIAS
jgi:hypothetical protein